MKILVIKLRYIGDTVLLTPAFRAIKAKHPDSFVSALVNDWTAPLLRNNPYIDEVIPFHRREAKGGGALSRVYFQLSFLLGLRKKRFDLVIDLTDSDRSAIAAFATGAPRRIGFNDEGRWRGHLLTDIVRPDGGLHIVDYHFGALRAAGIPPAGRELFLDIDPADLKAVDRFLAENGIGAGDFRLLIHPGARWKGKCWPPARFAELAERLSAARKAQVILATGPDAEERAILDAMRKVMTVPYVVFPPDEGLLRFAALCARCSLFVGNDSGPMHIAAAAGIPVVGLFGPSLPGMWGPLGARVATPRVPLDCSPCGHTVCHRPETNCMLLLDVVTVLGAVDSVLGEAGA